MATLEQILGFRNLTGVVQAIKSGIPNCLPDNFMTPGRKFSGNKAEYYKVTGSRKTARLVQYGSPAVRRNLLDVADVPVQLLHTFEDQQWPLALTIAISNMTSLTQDRMAEQQANWQTLNFKKLFANLRIAAAQYCLFQSKIFYDRLTGDLLPSSTASSYAQTIDFFIPANNTGNINGIIGTLWSQATAPIMTQLLQIQTTAVQTTGYAIEHAFYDDTVPGYIGRNTEAQQFLKLNPSMNNQYVTTGTIPNGFGGIKYWHPVGRAFYDYNGAVQKICPTNGVLFTPDYDPEWFEMYEGSFPVPTNILPTIGGDAAGALKQVLEVFGMFSYGQLTMNPPTVVQYAGDTFLPVLKVPAAIYQAVVA